MNIAKLKKLKKFILAEPRRYRQDYWLYGKESKVVQEQKPPCGTAGCLAGCAVLMEGYVPVWSAGGNTGEMDTCSKPLYERLYNVDDLAEDILGLTGDGSSSVLFDLDCWQEYARRAYLHAKTPRQRAEAAAMQLDFVIKEQKGKKK